MNSSRQLMTLGIATAGLVALALVLLGLAGVDRWTVLLVIAVIVWPLAAVGRALKGTIAAERRKP